MRAIQAMLGGVLQHRGVEAAVNEECAGMLQPTGSNENPFHHALAQFVIELRQRRVQCRFIAHRMAGEKARQLEVVIAQQEQAAAFVDRAGT